MITLLRLEIAVAAAKLYAPQIFKDEHNPSIKPIKKKSRNFSLHILQHSYSVPFKSKLAKPNQISNASDFTKEFCLQINMVCTLLGKFVIIAGCSLTSFYTLLKSF